MGNLSLGIVGHDLGRKMVQMTRFELMIRAADKIIDPRAEQQVSIHLPSALPPSPST